MGFYAKTLWLALPLIAGCAAVSQLSSQGAGTNSGGKAISEKDAAFDRVDFNQQYAQHIDNPALQSQVQTCVENIVKKDGIVGATVVCVIDGRLQAAVAVGERKLGSGVPIEVTDPMHIGSNTKGMTALVFGRLVEQGVLNWNETVGQVLGAEEAGKDADIPLIDLLRQTSGFSDEHSPTEGGYDYGYKGIPSIAERQSARKLYVDELLKIQPDFTPGTKWTYANSNYILLGYIEEHVTGTPWDKLMQQEVFGPLHMAAAGFGPMGSKDDISAPWQHNLVNGKFSPIWADNPLFAGPAGGVHCSALDLANYAYRRICGAYAEGGYLTSDSWRILQTPSSVNGGYACGICVSGPYPNGVRDMSHGGTNGESCSDWWVRDDGRVIIVSMVNCMSPDGNAEILKSLESMMNDKLK